MVSRIMEEELELAAVERLRSSKNREEAILFSIAISLKRIANALNEPNSFGEVGTRALSGAIVRGLNGDNR